MNCPKCEVLMEQVKTESHYGVPITLDRCSRCGGFWIDDDELYAVKFGEGQRIDALAATNSPGTQSSYVEVYSCPRDQTELKLFADPAFPQTVQVANCPFCGGFWFHRGEFAKFQQEFYKKRHKVSQGESKKSKNLQEEINELLGLRGES